MKTTATEPNPGLTTALLGVATVVAQSILLREAMAAMGGSETALGLVMALWLAGMSLGARLGVRIGSQRFATALPAVTLALAATGILLFRAAPAILGATAGESITTWYAVWLWTVAILPASCSGGLAFPILAEALGKNGAGRAYAIEAMGALAGGLILSFVLIRFGSAAALLVSTGGIVGIQTWSRRPAVALVLFATCCALASPVGNQLARSSWRWSGHPGELGAWAETRQQRLEASAGEPTALYANGRLSASYPDLYTVVPRAHLMMLLHPDPQRVLAVGCATDGSIEAMVDHQPEELLIVEDDPDLLPLLEKWYGNGFRRILDHSSIRLSGADSLTAIDSATELDLIILADGDPTTLRANRTRTTDFFRRCRNALAASGVLVLRVGVPDTYLGGTAGKLLATLTSTLKEVFPTVVAVPGERVLLVAGKPTAQITLEPEQLEHRLVRRPVAADSLSAAMLPQLVDATRQQDLAVFIENADSPPNTIRHPSAVALAANLHEARSQPTQAGTTNGLQPRGPYPLVWVLAAAIVCILATVIGPRRRTRIVAAAWVVGASSMGWWLLLLAVWQATRGAIYAEIGALTGLTMAGIAIGGWIGLQIGPPAQTLPGIIGGGVAVSLLVAAGVPLWAPLPLVPAFLVIGGILTGAAFPSLGALAGGDSARRGAAIAFSADEIGAAAAALIIGAVAMPWVGMTWSAAGLALLGLAAIPAAFRS